MGFFVVLAQAVHQVISGRNTLGERVLTGYRQGVPVQFGSGQSQIGKRLHQGTLGLVELVQHENLAFGNVAVQYNSIG